MSNIAGLHPLFHIGALASIVAIAMRGQLPLRVALLVSYLFYIVDDIVGTQQLEWPYLFWEIATSKINYLG